MDKLRAIEYFNYAAEHGSFAATARAFGVSTSAVTQLVGALERKLGTTLLHRTTRGLSLTAAGQRYYGISSRAAAELHAVEQHLGSQSAAPRGTLTVGMRASVGQQVVMPRIARFLDRYPDVEVIFKPITSSAEIDAKNLDLAVLAGWSPERDLVVRPLAQARHVVCAAPAYWARAGVPQHPDELRAHHCLIFRSAGGTLLDRWIFERNGERRTVDVRSRLLSDDRTLLDQAVCAGAGVARLTDLTVIPYLTAGLLVPVLTDWEALEAPTYFAAYPRDRRRSALVRAFVDFLVELFAELDRDRPLAGTGLPQVAKPEWFGRAQGRQSVYRAKGTRRS